MGVEAGVETWIAPLMVTGAELGGTITGTVTVLGTRLAGIVIGGTLAVTP